ncbi:MAG: MJ1255/VC2487 family glycosyltransferase [Pseudomonadota bacterium]
MKILYGVTGEGMGHATRSKVIVSHLVEAGHEVKIVVSGRAHAYLKRFFPDVEEIAGLRIIYEQNAVHRGRTFVNFLRELPLWGGWAGNFEIFTRLEESYRCDCVVSDFESFAYLYGKRQDVPVLSIDNMQVIDRCTLDVEMPSDERLNYAIARGIVAAKLPGCAHYLITSFFFPPVDKERTSLFPPILREEIVAARAGAVLGDHVLVYQTSDSYSDLIPMLRSLPFRFVVYGLGREETIGNVQLRAFSEQGFVADMASAGAVVSGGGFSLLSEAVYLGKPILSVPIKNQFEQLLNALYVEKLGYGRWVSDLSPRIVGEFLERRHDYARAVAAHRQDGNRQIFTALDELLAQVKAASYS